MIARKSTNQAAEHYYLITEPMEGVHRDLPVVEDPDCYGYFRPEGDGLLVGLFEPQAAAWELDGVPDGSRLSLEGYSWLRDVKLKDKFQVVKTEELRPIAEKLGCSLPQLAIAWTLKNDNCTTTILGATKLTQLEENLKALDVVDKITPEIMSEIDKVVEWKTPYTRIETQTRGIRKADTVHGLFR